MSTREGKSRHDALLDADSMLENWFLLNVTRAK